MVHAIQSKSEWTQKLAEANQSNKLVVVDFTATWCPPCKFIAPFFTELSEKYTDVLFLKVDVDDHNDIAGEYGVRAMPTFKFLKGGVVVDEVVGANKQELESKVLQHRGPVRAAFHGTGRTLGSGSSSSSSIATAAVTKPAASPIVVDESKPTASVQLRLADGSRTVGRFNTDHTVDHIRSYIDSYAASNGKAVAAKYTLQTVGFPPKQLTDGAQTIGQAGLANSVLIQRL